ncbi:MAG: AraC family transcriptional regulator [Hyphomonadaceae bacterium]
MFKVKGADRIFEVGEETHALQDQSALAVNAFTSLTSPSNDARDVEILSLSVNPTWLIQSLNIPNLQAASLFATCELPVSGVVKMCRNVILASMRAPQFLSKPIIEHQLSVIFRFSIALNGASIPKQISSEHENYGPRVSQAIATLNASRGQAIDSSELAASSGLSRSNLFAKFKEATGLTPLQYSTALRIEHAVEQLCDEAIPISEIALDLGFSSQANFSRFIKRHIGMSPGKFRRACVAL